MNFGEALELLKDGYKLAREGWNGKNMYVYLSKGYDVPVKNWLVRSSAQGLTEEERSRGYVRLGSHIDMMSAQGVRIIGWLASQTDMTADDWVVVE